MIMTVELQDVFREHFDDYQTSHAVTFDQWKAAQAIMGCRTSAYGGRVQECPECDYTTILYNSCRNRHCPKCQSLAQLKWVDARREDLLPVTYFHVVFTLPSELELLVLQNQKTLYSCLFKAVAETLKELASDPKYLGAQLGFTSVLHTWGQNLLFHPHIHCIVPNGGLTPHGTFQQGSDRFFLPLRVVSKMFRGKFLALLQAAFDKEELEFHGSIEHLNHRQYFAKLRHGLYQKDWYVHTERAFDGPEAVLQYLGRYTHRIAISNERILKLEDGMVTFSWKDYRDNQKKIMVLPAHEFIRRMLLHILPCGFMRIRHYGLLASCNRSTKLKQCQRLAGQAEAKARFRDLTSLEILTIVLGRDVTLCPSCGKASMYLTQYLGRSHAPPRCA